MVCLSRVMSVLLFSFVTRELGVMFVILFVCCARVAHNVYSLVCSFVTREWRAMFVL